MVVTTTYPEGMYVTMIAQCTYEARPELKLVKFKLPESKKAIIAEDETNQAEGFQKFSSKHDDYSSYTERHGDVIHIMIPNPDDEDE